jgi:DNA-binding LytR/AlgR family response regulator
VIVDDEPLARAVVREYVAAHPGVDVVAECANGFEAVKAVSELNPDLMFLDVARVRRYHVIPVDKIDYVEAQDDYVSFQSDGKSYLKDQTLGSTEGLLDPARFVRIHRSYLLNIDRIARVELYAKDSRVAILRDGTRLPVSRAGYARLARLL